MNQLETHSRLPVGQVRGKPGVRTDVRTQLGQCLVAATDTPKRAMISLAATEAGWETIVCADAGQAMEAVRRRRFQLAWVDGDVAPAPASFRELCQAVSTLTNVLLIVSGRENDVEEETWARRIGAWLYLPGLSLDCAGDIAMLCEQAQLAAGNVNDTA